MKRPKFEETKVITLFKNPRADGEMHVDVRYCSQKVRLLVKSQLPNREYVGQITHLENGSETCEDLTVGEEVIFQASNIFCIFK